MTMTEAPTTRIQRANESLSQFKLQQALNEAELTLAALEYSKSDITSRAQAHEIAGKAAYGLGRNPLAEEHLRQAILLFDELEAQEQLLSCQLFLAEVLFRQGQLRSARHLVNISLQQARKENWTPLIARSLTCLGNLAWVEGDTDTARDLLGQAIDLFDSLAMPSEASRTRCSLGAVYSICGDPQRASELSHLALSYFQQQHDYAQVARCLNNLAGVAFHQEDYARAREYLLQCVELEAEIGARGDMSPTWFNLGLIELSEANTKLAKKCFYRALQLAQESGDRGIEGSALLHLGIVALFENESAEASNFAQLAVAAFEGSSSQHAQISRLYMPVFLLASGNPEQGAAEWAKLSAQSEQNQLEHKIMAALLDRLSSGYSEADQAVTRRIRELALEWRAQLLHAGE
jgi:tetratricopeptide (TPR) repeat protein